MFIALNAFAKTTVSFEPDAVSLGESAELIFRSDVPFKELPDLSPLQAVLAVSGQDQRTYRENINGRKRSVYELSLNVFPRQEGEISTGVLKVNGQEIEAAILKVEGSSISANLPVSFDASVNVYDVYPQEVLLYTVKLTDGAGLLKPQLSNPVIEGARVVQLNMDKSYQDYQDNQRIHIFERTYAVIPEKSGYLTIPPLELYGSVSTRGQDYMGDLFAQGMLFDGFSSPQRSIRLETKPIQIKVLEKPTDWKGWWLPSKDVRLMADDVIPDTVSVGDSITRTIRLTALNTIAEALPVLKQSPIEGMKVYPSPEQRETIQTPVGDIQGVITLSVVFVPVQGGELKLPALELPWFNTKTGKMEKAFIPEKNILVQGKAVVQPVVQENNPKKSAKTIVRNKSQEQITIQDKNSEVSDNLFHFSWIIGFSVIGIVVGGIIGYWLSHRQKRKRRSYYLDAKHLRKKKETKKPIPDLYPF